MAGIASAISAENLPQEIVVDLHLSGGFATTIWASIDYSMALARAKQVFLETARALVPVRTGYLKSSIECEDQGLTVLFFAFAHYASYVEEGTWKMPARPYFQPALDSAFEAFYEASNEAVLQAGEELHARVSGYNMAGGSIDALHDQIDGVISNYLW